MSRGDVTAVAMSAVESGVTCSVTISGFVSGAPSPSSRGPDRPSARCAGGRWRRSRAPGNTRTRPGPRSPEVVGVTSLKSRHRSATSGGPFWIYCLREEQEGQGKARLRCRGSDLSKSIVPLLRDDQRRRSERKCSVKAHS